MKHNITTGALHASGIRSDDVQYWKDQCEWLEGKLKSAINQGQIQGIAYMTAELCRSGGVSSNIVVAWKSWGITVQECRENNVAEYDQEILEKYESILDK